MRWGETIEETGFAVLPELFSHDYLDSILKEIGSFGRRRGRAGIRHALGLSPVAEIASQAQMLDVVREVLGPEAFPYRATLFHKSQSANWLVVWHQDTALPLQSRLELPGWGPWSVKDGVDYAHAPAGALNKVLALRVSLDHSTVENGPLRVLPKTHTLGVLTDESLRKLSNEISRVDCIVPKGGVLAMKPLLVHSSSKSQSDMPRRVLHIEYATHATVPEPLELAVT